MTMWFEACQNPSMISSRFRDVSALNDFPIWDLQLSPDDAPAMSVSGHFSTLPDEFVVSEGHIAEQTDFGLAFFGLKEFSLTGTPTGEAGSFTMTKASDSGILFRYSAPDFQFTGSCQRVVITHVRVMTRLNLARPGPRGPQLFSHQNVWNTCLLLIRQLGYSLEVLGYSGDRGNILRYRWYAKKDDGTKLFADTPIELLGLVTLHRHHQPTYDDPYWWRIDGSPLVNELIDAFNNSSDTRNAGETEGVAR